MVNELWHIIRRNRVGHKAAIPSVCSAQPDVLRASLNLAKRLGRSIVIEATSNQVNQFGGYMDLEPQGFVDYVHRLIDQVGIDREAVIFGGDHLGTQAWRAQNADAAMAKAHDLVRAYVQAGFNKIHLDCSEGCLGESAQLPDEITAARSAALAKTCAREGTDLMFVVGTEVPPPGGARADDEGNIPATDPINARSTLIAHEQVFGDLKEKIGALVVQPGVEFGPSNIHHLPIDRDPGFLQALEQHPNICLEAHSTDYQDPAVFPRLAQLGFGFQKVGPALTFAYRRALYRLDQLRFPQGQLRAEMERMMIEHPAHWTGHYHGDEKTKKHLRHESYADRIRYYWPTPQAEYAVNELRRSFKAPISDQDLARMFPQDVLDLAEQNCGDQVQKLIDAHIQLALHPYFFEEAG